MAAQNSRFWDIRRGRRISAVMLLAVILSMLIVAFRDDQSTSLLKRGDFPAFYSVAVLSSRGAIDLIYDPVIIQQTELEFWPSLRNQYFAFAYPYYVAQLLTPLSAFPAHTAKMLFTAAMFMCLLLSLSVSNLYQRSFGGSLLISATLSLLFSPIFVGVLGGQNVGLSMLLFVLGCYCLVGEERPKEFLAGICFGLWLFKPSLAAPAIAFTALACGWSFLAGAALPAVGYYLISALYVGWGWPRSWIDQLLEFGAKDFERNQYQMISLTAVYRGINQSLSGAGMKTMLLGAIIIFGIFCILACAAAFLRVRFVKDPEVRREQLLGALNLLAPAIVLLSPHTLFYELGLCLFAVSNLIAWDTDRRVNFNLSALVIAFFLGLEREWFSIQPLFLYAAAIFIFSARDELRKISFKRLEV